MENDKNESTKSNDWQVTISQSLEVVEIKQMTIDMAKTRLKPVFLASGNLVIIIPAVSDREAKERALKIARQIASDKIWGMDLLDFTDFTGDRE